MLSRLAPFALVLLAGLAPFVSFAYANKTQVYDHSLLALYAGATACTTLLILAAIRVLGGKARFAQRANALAIAIFFFFVFGLFRSAVAMQLTQHVSFVTGALWLGAMLAAIAASWRMARQERLSSALLVIAAAMFVAPLASLSVFALSMPAARDAAAAGETRAFVQRPNIYFFLMDGYARADKLRELSGADNTPFLDSLRDSGFRVIDRATANYPTTWLSVSSTLSMRYIQTEDMPPYRSTAPHYRIMNGDSATVRRFRANGYRYVHLANGHPQFNCSGIADLCIGRQDETSVTAISDLELNLLQMTPLYYVLSRLAPDVLSKPFRGSISQVADVADEIAGIPLDQPFFLYAHLLVPHPPYLLDAQCRPNNNMADVSLRSWSREAIPAYAAYMQCANRQMMDLVGRILARDRQAVIVLQGDHGSGFLVDWLLPLRQWSQAGISERLAPLSAIRMPAACQDSLYDDMSLVNNFRAVTACLEGRRPQYLEDKSYITPDSDNREFGQVLRVRP
jgi:hypothetical protein